MRLPATSGGQPPLVRKSLLIPVCLLLAGCSSQAGSLTAGPHPIGLNPVGLNPRHTAELDVVSGASTVLVRSANLGAALYRAEDPAQVEVRDDVVERVQADADGRSRSPSVRSRGRSGLPSHGYRTWTGLRTAAG